MLLSRGRGSGKELGEFRRSQNWIGGTRPGNAAFVPPPHAAVPECMAALERFLHGDEDGLPALQRAGLSHAQFETIHPFLDGNGRLGRLLITFLLCQAGVLHEPLFDLGLYLKQNRAAYYELLDAVRRDGDWEAWLAFFLAGVEQVAEGAVSTAERLSAMFRADRTQVEAAGRRAGSALKGRPIQFMPGIRDATGLSFPAVSSAMSLLVDLGIARELTGKPRDRRCVYDGYLAVLNEWN